MTLLLRLIRWLSSTDERSHLGHAVQGALIVGLLGWPTAWIPWWPVVAWAFNLGWWVQREGVSGLAERLIRGEPWGVVWAKVRADGLADLLWPHITGTAVAVLYGVWLG